MSKDNDKIQQLLERIAVALEAHRPAVAESVAAQLRRADAFVWEAEGTQLVPVKRVAALPLTLLKGIDLARDTLFENTRRFANGLPANNALLWGARGTGKSSLVKAAHAAINDELKRREPLERLALIELHREDLPTLPRLLGLIRNQSRRCILFCDDLSFDAA